MRSASLEGKSAAQTNEGVATKTLYLLPFMALVILVTVNVWVVTPVYGVTAFGGLDWTKFVQFPPTVFSCHW